MFSACLYVASRLSRNVLIPPTLRPEWAERHFLHLFRARRCTTNSPPEKKAKKILYRRQLYLSTVGQYLQLILRISSNNGEDVLMCIVRHRTERLTGTEAHRHSLSPNQ